MKMFRLFMDLKRRLGVRNTFILLVLGNVVTVLCLHGQSLDCTNDFEKFIFCQFGGENCTEYNMTLKSIEDDDDGDKGCIFKQCGSSQCCCSVEMDLLYAGYRFEATVWERGKNIESKTFSVTDTIKPKTPTIISVTESNGNFKVVWSINMEGIFSRSLTGNVTYHIKGDTQKYTERVDQTANDGKNFYEIQGRLLKPSTTYVVSVRSLTNWNEKFSDSSNEVEFTTPMSSSTLFLAIVISLSVTAILLSGAIYGCYVKFKTKWWDSAAKCSKPKLLHINPGEKEVLKPVAPVISSVCVEPLSDEGRLWVKDLQDSSSGSLQQSSGISTGSSYLSYVNTEPPNIIADVHDAISKALAHVFPVPPVTNGLLADPNKDSSLLCAPNNPYEEEDMGSGSSAFLNETYSIFIPGCAAQNTMDMPAIQNPMVCESAYHPSEGITVISTYQQTPACPLIGLQSEGSPSMPTDLSYQPCNADSGRFSLAGDSSSSSVCSGTNTTPSCDLVPRVEAECQSFDNENIEKDMICDENPCYSSTPSGSHSLPVVDYDYQSFQSLVEQPITVPPEKEGEKEEHLGENPEESSVKKNQTLLNPGVVFLMDKSQSLSEQQRPFLSLIPAVQSTTIITDSGYQCV